MEKHFTVVQGTVDWSIRVGVVYFYEPLIYTMYIKSESTILILFYSTDEHVTQCENFGVKYNVLNYL